MAFTDFLIGSWCLCSWSHILKVFSEEICHKLYFVSIPVVYIPIPGGAMHAYCNVSFDFWQKIKIHFGVPLKICCCCLLHAAIMTYCNSLRVPCDVYFYTAVGHSPRNYSLEVMLIMLALIENCFMILKNMAWNSQRTKPE